MNKTNANSSTASKEVKEEIKMGFKVCGAIHREEPIKQNKRNTKYEIIIDDSEIIEYVNSFENFVEKDIGKCKITKDSNNKIISAITATKKYNKNEKGEFVATPRTRVAER